jgi:hypothetical protein
MDAGERILKARIKKQETRLKIKEKEENNKSQAPNNI